MRLLIRWVGYGFIVVGVALFIASYLVTYNRGGISAIAERFYHPLADAFQLAMCIGPGLLLIGIADWLEKKKETHRPLRTIAEQRGARSTEHHIPECFAKSKNKYALEDGRA